MHTDDLTTAVRAASQAWVTAFNARDPARICACYHLDAVLWGTTAQALITTAAGIRHYFDGHCAASTPLRVTLTDQRIRIYGGWAINSGSYTLEAVLAGSARSLPARFNFTYQKTDDGWLIVDHHSSWVPAPVQIG